MKLLKSSEQAIVPANLPAHTPVVYIITDPTVAQQLLSPTGDIPVYQQHQQPYKTNRHESRIKRLIRDEKEILQDTFDDFGRATRNLLGTLISWIIWRIVVPLSVISALWIAFVASAELPV